MHTPKKRKRGLTLTLPNSTFMLPTIAVKKRSNHTHKLADDAPIFGTWIPRKTGADFPDGTDGNIDCIGIIANHIEYNKESRDYYLIVNGPGFEGGQIDGIRKKFKEKLGDKANQIFVVDLHEYDWSKIDEGCKLDGEDISIEDYFKNMYGNSDKDRMYLPEEIDTFRMISHALFPQIVERCTGTEYKGAIYVDHDTLGAINSHIGKDIRIPEGILVGKINSLDSPGIFAYNNLIALDDPSVAYGILSTYKDKLLSQKAMCHEIREKFQNHESHKYYTLDKKANTINELLPQDKPLINDIAFYANREDGIIISNVEFQKILHDTVSELKEKQQGDVEDFDFQKNNGNFCSEVQSTFSWKNVPSAPQPEVSKLAILDATKEERNKIFADVEHSASETDYQNRFQGMNIGGARCQNSYQPQKQKSSGGALSGLLGGVAMHLTHNDSLAKSFHERKTRDYQERMDREQYKPQKRYVPDISPISAAVSKQSKVESQVITSTKPEVERPESSRPNAEQPAPEAQSRVVIGVALQGPSMKPDNLPVSYLNTKERGNGLTRVQLYKSP